MIKFHTAIFLCFISGAILPLAFSPFHWSFIAFISPAILFWCSHHLTLKQSTLCGFLFGFAYLGVGVSWIQISINLFGNMNWFWASLITLLFILFLAIFYASIPFVAKRFFHSSGIVSLCFVYPLLWVLFEWIRGWVLTGFPWLTIGYSQTNNHLSGIASVMGVYGLSFCIVIISGVIATLLLPKSVKNVIFTIPSLLFFVMMFSVGQLTWVEPSVDKKSLKVALIQANIEQKIKWKANERYRTMLLYDDLTRQIQQADIIIWPENAIPAFYDQLKNNYLKPLILDAQRKNAELLVGLPVWGDQRKKYYNSMIHLSEKSANIYKKRHLVPFGEFMPLASILKPILSYFHIPMSAFSTGSSDESPLLFIKNQWIGLSICYEDAFGQDIIKALPKASFLVNASNDAWFGHSLAPHQHLEMAQMRAIETGRYLVRATSTGISAIINEKGKILKQSPQFEQHILQGKIIPFKGKTPYVMLGNKLIIALIFFLLLTIKLSEPFICSNKTHPLAV